MNWKSVGLDKLKAVTQALSKLKQRAIWKLDVELPFQVPNNVMIVKWMPQDAILSTFHNLLKDTKNTRFDIHVCNSYL